MPAKKTTTPEGEQKKLWKLEMKTLETARRKICTDFRTEQKRLIATSEAAHKAVLRFQARVDKQGPKLLSKIDRRLGFLRGRSGL